jgi:hypothetical protein
LAYTSEGAIGAAPGDCSRMSRVDPIPALQGGTLDRFLLATLIR